MPQVRPKLWPRTAQLRCAARATQKKGSCSQINAGYGLTAAQEMLRHADIAVTAAHYVENKRRSVLGFGKTTQRSKG